MKIIICPKCKGKGEVKESNALNPGKFGVIFTFGVLNALDYAMSQTWKEDCPKCEGNGKIIVKLKQEGLV